jgi:hypothetical protein
MSQILLGLAAVAQAATATPPAPLDPAAEIAKNVLVVEEATPGEFGGAGWDRLVADGVASQFMMIGEQHGSGDIARFEAAVQRAMFKAGYTNAAYEIGPFSADYAERLIRSGTGQLASYLRKPGNGFAFPFLFFGEELAMAEQAIAASPDKADAIWGLDQEFAAASPVIIDLLRPLAKTPAQKSGLEAFVGKAKANPQIIAAAPWSEFSGLEAAFANNARARDLIAALKLSNEIYSPFTGRGGFVYDANLRRETYMKVNFAQRFAAAEKRTGRAPKVFLKFGGYHAQKGVSGTNVLGLGNFLYEWGQPRGFKLTNVMVECVGGESLNPMANKPIPCAPYFAADSAFAKLTKPDRYTLVDLRPMRPLLRRMASLDQESRTLILSFDYYLAIKDVKAATFVAAQR